MTAKNHNSDHQPQESQFASKVAMFTTAFIVVQGVSVLSYCMIQKLTPEPALMTVYVGIITSAATGLIALVANPNPRRASGLQITNTPEEPVPTKPVE